MHFQLRAAVESDWDRCWPLQREAFRDLVTRTYGGWTSAQAAKVRGAWSPELTRLIEVEGRLAGWIKVEHRVEHDWLDVIVVDPSMQGRGLGAAVLRRLIAEAEARGVALHLSVYRTNPARQLYRRLGFVESPRDELRLLMVYEG